jgi:UDP:flavonoid glycosyltransferase YjiC (YdhE family)
MRVLFTTLPTSGHWHPLVPFARALQQAGHEVGFATAPGGCAPIAASGFRCFPVGADETATEVAERRAKLAALGADSPAWAMPNFFAGPLAARRLPDLLAVCDGWRPAVLVREDSEFAGCVAAEARGLPHAAVQISAWRPWLLPLVAEPLGRLRERVGLPADPDLAMPHRHLLIVTAPPSFYADPAAPLPVTARFVRHVAFDHSGDEELPAWFDDLPNRPVVYATMGTVFNKVPGVLEQSWRGCARSR